MNPRRQILLLGSAAAVGLPVVASPRRAMVAMGDGPFYPPRPWRERGPLAGDWDADLTRVERAGRVATARGEHLALLAVVADTDGRVIDGAEVEFWQCDTLMQYRHPDVALTPVGRYDDGFQGFGSARSGKDGSLRLRTIKPVVYPGRTPHIHVKLKHPAFGELASQLFLAGDTHNARDFLWRRVPAPERAALEMTLLPAPADSGLRWVAQQTLVVPA